MPETAYDAPKSIRLLNVRVENVTYDETLQWVAKKISHGAVHQICTVNPEFIMRAQSDGQFAKVLEQSGLNVPDGVGVLWAAKWQGHKLHERVAGSTLLPMMCALAAEHCWRVFFLGARKGVAEMCASIMQHQFPSLNIAGAIAGSPEPQHDESLLEQIRASDPHIIFVAYGAPKQECWLARNLPLLHTETMSHGVVGIGVGGAFDFIAGVRRRAPEWAQRLGLEWLHRLVQEPWRWRRQYWVLFVLRVIFGR